MPAGLNDLPPELMLMVVESLSAAEMQRTRAICRDLHTFVDTHTCRLARAIRTQERNRLQNEIKEAVGYKDEQLGLVAALRRWTRRRGISTHAPTQKFQATLFTLTHASALMEAPLTPPVKEFVACIVRRLMQVHLYHARYKGAIPPSFENSSLFLEMIEKDTGIPISGSLPHQSKEIARFFREVSTEGLEGQILRRKDDQASLQPITPYIEYIPTADSAVTMSGSVNLESLDVPSIPARSIGHIAYFSRKESHR